MSPPRPNESAARLGRLLLISFAFTILSFLGSAAVSEYRAQGILVAAESITAGLPSVEHLTRARTELHRVGSSLDALLDRAAAGQDADQSQLALQRERDAFHREWSAYLTLPSDRDDARQWDHARAAVVDLDASLDDVLAKVQVRPSGFADGRARVDADVDRVDDNLAGLVEINTRKAAELGEKIAFHRRASRSWAFALDAASAVFATLAAFMAIRLVRRFTQLTEFRIGELEQFSSRVAHDIRSPLTSVGLALDLGKRDPDLDPKMRTMFDRATQTLQRVAQVVDGLLVFARSGATPAEDAHADVRAVLTGIIDEVLPTAEEQGIELEVVDAPSSVVACSPGVLTSLISNLVGNALKYLGNSPVKRISVRVRDLGSLTRIEVEDTGPGVPTELRGRIFDPYVRGAGSTVPGLGLGLATVRRLAEAHGGAAGMDEHRTLGSLFWFELPKAALPHERGAPSAHVGGEITTTRAHAT